MFGSGGGGCAPGGGSASPWRRRRRLRRAVFVDEVAAELNAMPEQAEEVGRHRAAGDLFRIALSVAADRWDETT